MVKITKIEIYTEVENKTIKTAKNGVSDLQ